jgi:hypothetical protein
MRTRPFVAMFVACVALLGVPSLARALPIVSLSPPSQDAEVGDPVSVDIRVDGLTDAIGGFSLTLDFDDEVLEGVGYTIGGALGLGNDESFGFAVGAGSLDLYFTSVADESTLAAAQGTGFILATVTFQALTDGLSPLTLLNVVLSDATGAEEPFTQRNGDVCVGGDCAAPVPEPGTILLVASGLGAAISRRYRRKGQLKG